MPPSSWNCNSFIPRLCFTKVVIQLKKLRTPNFNPLNSYIYNYNFWFGGINELSTSCIHFAIGSTHELCNSKRSPDHAVASMGAREKGECGSRRWAWVLERERVGERERHWLSWFCWLHLFCHRSYCFCCLQRFAATWPQRQQKQTHTNTRARYCQFTHIHTNNS